MALAFRAGKTLTACPYPTKSPEALSWHSGFIEGKAKHEWNERGNCLKPRCAPNDNVLIVPSRNVLLTGQAGGGFRNILMTQQDHDRLVALKKQRRADHATTGRRGDRPERGSAPAVEAAKGQGDKALVHALRGRPSNRKLDEKTTKAVEILGHEVYHGFLWRRCPGLRPSSTQPAGFAGRPARSLG